MSNYKLRGPVLIGSATGRYLLVLAALLAICSMARTATAGGSAPVNQFAAGSAISPAIIHPLGYGAVFQLTSVTSPGACVDGYANQCVSGNCECLTLSGRGAGSRFGVASSVIGEMTLDLGNNPGDPDGVCFPTFGFLAFVGTKDTETVDFVGASCEGFDAGTATTFNGGWEYADPGVTTFDAVGQAKGAFGIGSLRLSLTGKALP